MKKLLCYLLLACMAFGGMQGTAMAEEMPTWQDEAPMTTARHNFGSAVVGNKIYIIGGDTTTTATTSVEIYDTETGLWSEGNPMPTAKSRFSAVAIGDKIYTIGGSAGAGALNFLSKVEIYDTITGNWSVGEPMPTGRQSSGMVAVGEEIYVIGGNDGTFSNKVESYNTKTNKWRTVNPMPTGRAFSAVAKIDDKIYVIGGNAGSTRDIVEIYDIATDTWSAGSPLTYPIQSARAISIDEKIYLIGGSGSGSTNDSKNSVSIYDNDADTWSEEMPMNTARIYHCAEYVNGKIYAMGGRTNTSSVILNTMESLDVNPSPSLLAVLLDIGETTRLSVFNNLSDNLDYIWSSDDEAVAVVDESGVVTAVGEGLARITAENEDGTYRESIPVRVIQGVSEKRLAVDLIIGQQARLYLSDSEDIIWHSIDESVVSVDQDGRITGEGRGLALVQAEVDGDAQTIYVRVRQA